MNIDYMTPEDYEELVEALRTCRQPLPLDDEQIRAVARRARVREVLRGDVVLLAVVGAHVEELPARLLVVPANEMVLRGAHSAERIATSLRPAEVDHQLFHQKVLWPFTPLNG